MKYGYVSKQLIAKPAPSTDDPSAAPTGKSTSAIWIAIYAIAVGVTPEFTLMGIPKVRITDLLLPFILGGGVKLGKEKLPFASLLQRLIVWNFLCLFLWGQAPMSPGIFYLGKRIVYGLVAYAAFKGIDSVKNWNRVVRLLVFASPLLSFTVLHELSSHIEAGGIESTGEGMRASGIIANQETSTALYIAVISCISLGAWDAFKDASWRVGTIVSLITGCAAIMATGSRGGLACIALCVIVTAAQNRKRGPSLIMGALMIGAIGWNFTPPELQERLGNIFPETGATFNALTGDDSSMPVYGSSSIADRALTARKAFEELIPNAGLFGLGTAYKKLGAIDDFYITEWVYHGLIGLALFVYLQLALIKGCYLHSLQARDPAEKGVARGALTAVVCMSASGIHADTFYLIRPMEAMALLLGLVAARRRMSK